MAVGQNSEGRGVVVAITDGTPGGATVMPGTTSLSGVTCPRATMCETAGDGQPRASWSSGDAGGRVAR